MALYSMKEILADAQKRGYGVGYFIVTGWIALGMVTAIVTMLSQIPRSA